MDLRALQTFGSAGAGSKAVVLAG